MTANPINVDDKILMKGNSDATGDPFDTKDTTVTPPTKKSYGTVCFLYGYYSIVFTLMIPVLPALMLDQTNDNSSHAAYLYGIASFVRYICEFFASPVMGSLADYKGRKPMLILAFLICAVEFALLFFFPSVGMIFVTRAMAGIGDCAQATCYTIATDIALFNKDIVTNPYGLISAMMGAGFIVGPLLGGLLVEMLSINACILVATFISFLGAVLTMFLLEESLQYNVSTVNRVSTDGSAGWRAWLKEIDPINPLIQHFSIPIVRQLSYPLMLSSFVYGLGLIWYIYMDDRYNANATIIGVYLAVYGVSAVTIQGVVIKRLIPRVWNEKEAAMFGYFIQAVQYVTYGLVPSVWGLFGAVVFFAPGLVADPALKALIVKASVTYGSTIHIQGNLQGAISGIRTLCTAFGALVFPTLYSVCIDKDPNLAWVAFTAGGCCYFLASVILRASNIGDELLSKKKGYKALSPVEEGLLDGERQGGTGGGDRAQSAEQDEEQEEEIILSQAAVEDRVGLLVVH